jgi:hypothetical protein
MLPEQVSYRVWLVLPGLVISVWKTRTSGMSTATPGEPDFFNKRNPERDALERLMRNDRVVISVITLMEVRRGWNPE